MSQKGEDNKDESRNQWNWEQKTNQDEVLGGEVLRHLAPSGDVDSVTTTVTIQSCPPFHFSNSNAEEAEEAGCAFLIWPLYELESFSHHGLRRTLGPIPHEKCNMELLFFIHSLIQPSIHSFLSWVSEAHSPSVRVFMEWASTRKQKKNENKCTPSIMADGCVGMWRSESWPLPQSWCCTVEGKNRIPGEKGVWGRMCSRKFCHRKHLPMAAVLAIPAWLPSSLTNVLQLMMTARRKAQRLVFCFAISALLKY